MTVAEFKAAFTEFDTDDAATIQRIIDDSAGDFDSERWGDKATKGLGLLVAHRMVIEKRLRAMGPSSGMNDVVSATFESPSGRQSQSRDAAAMAAARENPEASTLYGVEYLRLCRQAGMGGAVSSS